MATRKRPTAKHRTSKPTPPPPPARFALTGCTITQQGAAHNDHTAVAIQAVAHAATANASAIEALARAITTPTSTFGPGISIGRSD